MSENQPPQHPANNHQDNPEDPPNKPPSDGLPDTPIDAPPSQPLQQAPSQPIHPRPDPPAEDAPNKPPRDGPADTPVDAPPSQLSQQAPSQPAQPPPTRPDLGPAHVQIVDPPWPRQSNSVTSRAQNAPVQQPPDPPMDFPANAPVQQPPHRQQSIRQTTPLNPNAPNYNLELPLRFRTPPLPQVYPPLSGSPRPNHFPRQMDSPPPDRPYPRPVEYETYGPEEEYYWRIEQFYQHGLGRLDSIFNNSWYIPPPPLHVPGYTFVPSLGPSANGTPVPPAQRPPPGANGAPNHPPLLPPPYAPPQMPSGPPHGDLMQGNHDPDFPSPGLTYHYNRLPTTVGPRDTPSGTPPRAARGAVRGTPSQTSAPVAPTGPSQISTLATPGGPSRTPPSGAQQDGVSCTPTQSTTDRHGNVTGSRVVSLGGVTVEENAIEDSDSNEQHADNNMTSPAPLEPGLPQGWIAHHHRYTSAPTTSRGPSRQVTPNAQQFTPGPALHALTQSQTVPGTLHGFGPSTLVIPAPQPVQQHQHTTPPHNLQPPPGLGIGPCLSPSNATQIQTPTGFGPQHLPPPHQLPPPQQLPPPPPLPNQPAPQPSATQQIAQAPPSQPAPQPQQRQSSRERKFGSISKALRKYF